MIWPAGRRWPWLAALVASTALAYVLPAASIVRHMSEKRHRLELFSLRIEGSASFFGDSAGEVQRSLSLIGERTEISADAVLSFKLPGRCRVDLSSVEGGKVAAALSHGKPRVEGAPPTAVVTALEHLCVLFATRSSSEGEAQDALMRHLERLKVNTTMTSLARFAGNVAYVIGATEPGAAQLWVYKTDEFWPARLRFTDAQGVAWDLRLVDYTSPATGEWFPRSVELYRDNALQVRLTGLRADNRSKLADTLF